MSERSYDQVLKLSILGCQTIRSFRRHQAGYPSFSRVVTSCLFRGPYVEIGYRLGVEQNPNQEIWSCDLSARQYGFCVVSTQVNVQNRDIIIRKSYNCYELCDFL